MLAAGPRSFIVFDKTFHAVPQRHGLGLGSLQRCHARALAGDGVDALKAELAGIPGLLPRLGEREHMHRADTHVSTAAIGDVAINPLLRATLRDTRIAGLAGSTPGRPGSSARGKFAPVCGHKEIFISSLQEAAGPAIATADRRAPSPAPL